MRSRAALAGCAIALALLAGCSAPAEPEATVTSPVAPVPSTATGAAEPTAAATASHTAGGPPTASVSPTGASIPVPPPPADMARDDEAGAIAAAEYFLTDLYPYTLSARDAEAWLAMSDPGCEYCASLAKAVETMREADRTVTVTRPTVTNAEWRVVEAGLYYVRFRLTTGPSYYYSASGNLDSQYPVTTGVAELNMSHGGDRWLVVNSQLSADQAAE